MVNLVKILGFNLSADFNTHILTAVPYETNSQVSQYQEVILEVATTASITNPQSVEATFTLPDATTVANIHLSPVIGQPNKFRVRLNEVIGNKMVVGNTNTIQIGLRLMTDVSYAELVEGGELQYRLYRTSMDTTYHPTDIDVIFISLNKFNQQLSENIVDYNTLNSTLENIIDGTDPSKSRVKEAVKATYDSEGNEISETYAKLEDIPTKVSELENDKGYLTEHQSLKGYATEKWVEDKKYLTEHQSLDNYYKKYEVDVKTSNAETNAKNYAKILVNDLIGSAPDTLDTLQEIANYINSDEEAAKTMTANIQKNTEDIKSISDKTEASVILVNELEGQIDYIQKSQTDLTNRVDGYDGRFAQHYTISETDKKFATKEELLEAAVEVVANPSLTGSEQSLTSVGINGVNYQIVGSGGGSGDVNLSNYYTKSQTEQIVENSVKNKQDKLISGNNIKTINGNSIVGSGNLEIQPDLSAYAKKTDLNGLANTTYVDQKVAGIINSAPETLNTLEELANALGDDPNFATTVSTQIGLKANASDVYLKSQTYSKTEIDNKGFQTASDVAENHYTKTELDSTFTERDKIIATDIVGNETNSTIALYHDGTKITGQTDLSFKTVKGNSIIGTGDIDVTTVKANPTVDGSETVLSTIEINEAKYIIGGQSGGVEMVFSDTSADGSTILHNIQIGEDNWSTGYAELLAEIEALKARITALEGGN